MHQAPTYVSSAGQLATPPLTKRVVNTLRDYATIGYLFVDTLVTVSRTSAQGEMDWSACCVCRLGMGSRDLIFLYPFGLSVFPF
jgi:hypothetical protein